MYFDLFIDRKSHLHLGNGGKGYLRDGVFALQAPPFLLFTAQGSKCLPTPASPVLALFAPTFYMTEISSMSLKQFLNLLSPSLV